MPCDTPACEPLPGAWHDLDGRPTWVVAHGSGPPVVLLHGIPTSSYLWRHVQRALAAHCRTLAPDLAGMGRTSGTDRVALSDQAELVRALLDAQGIERAIVVGHDVGGGVAALLAARHPHRIRALIIADAVAFARYWPVPMVRLLQVPVVGDLALLLPPHAVLRPQMRRGVDQPELLTEPVLQRHLGALATWDGRRAFIAFVRALDPLAVEHAVHACAGSNFPRRVLWAAHDVFQPPEEGTALHAAWPGSTLRVIADAGHFLPEERPLAVVDEVLAVLEQESARPGRADRPAGR